MVREVREREREQGGERVVGRESEVWEVRRVREVKGRLREVRGVKREEVREVRGVREHGMRGEREGGVGR